MKGKKAHSKEQFCVFKEWGHMSLVFVCLFCFYFWVFSQAIARFLDHVLTSNHCPTIKSKDSGPELVVQIPRVSLSPTTWGVLELHSILSSWLQIRTPKIAAMLPVIWEEEIAINTFCINWFWSQSHITTHASKFFYTCQ